MSQVRISDSITNDPRFKELVTLILESIDILRRDEAEEMALGKCWRAFHLAQSYWRDDRKLVPLKIWKLGSNASFASLLLRVGLAEERNDAIYVCGARQYFDWYHDKKEAGRIGGIKSAKLREEKKTSQADQADVSSKPSRRSKHPTCSVSDSVSVSVSDSESRERGWPPSDPLAKVFENLKAFPAYWRIFDLDRDRNVIGDHMKRHNLTAAEMERVTWELKNWVDGAKGEIKSPRGKLATFVGNFAERKAKNAPAAPRGSNYTVITDLSQLDD